MSAGRRVKRGIISVVTLILMLLLLPRLLFRLDFSDQCLRTCRQDVEDERVLEPIETGYEYEVKESPDSRYMLTK